MGKPKIKGIPTKVAMKSKIGFIAKKSYSYTKTAKTVKPSIATRQVNRNLNRVAKQSSPKVTIASRRPRKPPTKGR